MTVEVIHQSQPIHFLLLVRTNQPMGIVRPASLEYIMQQMKIHSGKVGLIISSDHVLMSRILRVPKEYIYPHSIQPSEEEVNQSNPVPFICVRPFVLCSSMPLTEEIQFFVKFTRIVSTGGN